jgi:tetratricopeptide (TPR) repeat protein
LAAIDAALRSGGWAAAGALLEAARARYPDHAELLLLESRRLRQQGQPEEALTCCDCALSTAKDPGSVQLEIAECHLALSDLPAALDALQVAVTLSPQLGSAWLRLGEVLVRLDRHVEALEVLPPAIEHSASPAAHGAGMVRVRAGVAP